MTFVEPLVLLDNDFAVILSLNWIEVRNKERELQQDNALYRCACVCVCEFVCVCVRVVHLCFL